MKTSLTKAKEIISDARIKVMNKPFFDKNGTQLAEVTHLVICPKWGETITQMTITSYFKNDFDNEKALKEVQQGISTAFDDFEVYVIGDNPPLRLRGKLESFLQEI